MDFEDRLRQSLQARAHDVEPDPAMFREVQRRVRRGRFLRWSLAGVGAVAVVAAAALTVPSGLDRRIEFDPAPVGTQPPPDGPAVEAAAPCSDDGEALVAVVARDGDLVAHCSSGAFETLTATDTGGAEDAPALSPDGALLAYEATHGHSAYVEVFDLATGESVETIDGASSPAFSAAGHLAYIRLGDQGDQPRLVVREGNGDAEQESAMAPDDMPDGFSTRHLVWAAGDVSRILYWEARYEGTTVWGDDYVESGGWRFEAEPGSNYAAPASREDGRLHVLRTCCVEVEGDTADLVELGVLTLPDTDARFDPIITLPDEFDAGGMLTLAAAGSADIDPASGTWTSGGTAAWLVGDGDALYLVDEDGNADLVAEGVSGFAFNPAVTLPAGPETPPSPGTLAQVDVHFAAEGSECGDDVEPFPSSVDGPGVLRGALEHLLGGPTPEEIGAGASTETGFSGATSGLLNDVSIAANGVARIDFSAELAEHFWSTACMSGQLFHQLEPTIRQFPTVEEVVYSFDGSIEDFYSYYQMEAPPHRPDVPLSVTRMQERIRGAIGPAYDGDWSELAKLTDRETLSCSFSDQNENCIAIWKDQQRNGEDPLGVMAELLRGEPAKNPNAPIWAWPVEYITSNEYLGPRLGIDEDGAWRFFVLGGD